MSDAIRSRFEAFATAVLPCASTFLLMLFGLLPVGRLAFSPLPPLFVLIGVYYWCCHDPRHMPAWCVFLLGLVSDLMGNGALGVITFTLLLVYAAIATRRRFFANRNLAVHWAIFLPVAALSFFSLWLFNTLIRGVYFDPNPVLFQFLVTLVAFPVCAWILSLLNRRSPGAARA